MALDVFSLAFTGTSEDEIDPFVAADFANVERNSYGRSVQRVCSTARQQEVVRPVANDPMIPSSVSAFTAVISTSQTAQETVPRAFPQTNYLSISLCLLSK